MPLLLLKIAPASGVAIYFLLISCCLPSVFLMTSNCITVTTLKTKAMNRNGLNINGSNQSRMTTSFALCRHRRLIAHENTPCRASKASRQNLQKPREPHPPASSTASEPARHSGHRSRRNLHYLIQCLRLQELPDP